MSEGSWWSVGVLSGLLVASCLPEQPGFNEPVLAECPEGTRASGGVCRAVGRVVVGPEVLGPARVGVAFEAAFEAAGGEGPISFSAMGALPPGLSLTAQGVLEGTPSVAGTTDFVVVASDESGLSGGVSVSLEVVGSTCGTPEVCDGVDNDCDGQVDEGVRNDCGLCGPVPDDICDGEDNDCDLEIDEGVTNACGGCGQVPQESCDGVDNDCDGQIDEGACGELDLVLVESEVIVVDRASRRVRVEYGIVLEFTEGSIAFTDALYLVDPEAPNVVVETLDLFEQPPMAAFESRAVVRELQIPERIASGTWFITVVTDTRGVLGEANQTNNTLRAAFLYLAPAEEGCVPASGVRCAGGDFRDSDLEGEDLSGADLAGADLRRSDLREADLSGANLNTTTLRAADLRGADLSGADLSGADLQGANLREADLSGANLFGADLEGASLRGANLSGANLRTALMTTTGLRDAIWSGTICPDGTNSDQNGGTCEGFF